MNCVPSLDMERKNRNPLLSMHVTPLRSTVQVRPFCARCLFFQLVLSSPTHGSTKRPSSVHLCSVSVSAMVIRNIRVARFLRSVAEVASFTDQCYKPISNYFPALNFYERDIVRNRLRI